MILLAPENIVRAVYIMPNFVKDEDAKSLKFLKENCQVFFPSLATESKKWIDIEAVAIKSFFGFGTSRQGFKITAIISPEDLRLDGYALDVNPSRGLTIRQSTIKAHQQLLNYVQEHEHRELETMYEKSRCVPRYYLIVFLCKRLSELYQMQENEALLSCYQSFIDFLHSISREINEHFQEVASSGANQPRSLQDVFLGVINDVANIKDDIIDNLERNYVASQLAEISQEVGVFKDKILDNLVNPDLYEESEEIAWSLWKKPVVHRGYIKQYVENIASTMRDSIQLRLDANNTSRPEYFSLEDADILKSCGDLVGLVSYLNYLKTTFSVMSQWINIKGHFRLNQQHDMLICLTIALDALKLIATNIELFFKRFHKKIKGKFEEKALTSQENSEKEILSLSSLVAELMGKTVEWDQLVNFLNNIKLSRHCPYEKRTPELENYMKNFIWSLQQGALLPSEGLQPLAKRFVDFFTLTTDESKSSGPEKDNSVANIPSTMFPQPSAPPLIPIAVAYPVDSPPPMATAYYKK